MRLPKYSVDDIRCIIASLKKKRNNFMLQNKWEVPHVTLLSYLSVKAISTVHGTLASLNFLEAKLFHD